MPMPTSSKPSPSLPPEILAYYQEGKESRRLFSGPGQLEFARTQEIVLRYLPPPPAVIYDVGGGPGLYAVWLAGLGYQVHLVDIAPLHIEQARQASLLQPDHPLASLAVGDARSLEREQDSVDLVLLLGPLYHLTNRPDRLAALREAHRILRPGGVLLAAAISRFASALDGLREGYLQDPQFVQIVAQDLKDGQHRNLSPAGDYFTTAYFHRPDELQAEVAEAGFQDSNLLAIEGPGWLFQDFEAQWQDEGMRAMLLQVVRWLEAEPSLLGASAHLLVVAQK